MQVCLVAPGMIETEIWRKQAEGLHVEKYKVGCQLGPLGSGPRPAAYFLFTACSKNSVADPCVAMLSKDGAFTAKAQSMVVCALPQAAGCCAQHR